MITTYEGVRVNRDDLLAHRWEYVILDEGHKIRNPDSDITLSCKKFKVTAIKREYELIIARPRIELS